MINVFTKILTKRFTRIVEEQEFEIEDAARLLAQALVSDGKIYIYGEKEMDAIAKEAATGHDSLPNAVHMSDINDVNKLTEFDRLLIVSRLSTDEHALELAKRARELGVPAVAISAVVADKEGLQDLVEVQMDTTLVQPILPEESGEFFAFPSVMMAFFAYYGIFITLREIMEDM